MASVSRDQPIRPTAQSRSVAFFYFHPSDQFRPVLSVGLAANHTNAAAGIRIVSHFDPPTRAAVPSTTRTKVKAIDFFEFALILKSSRNYVLRNHCMTFILADNRHFRSATIHTSSPDRAESRCARHPGKSW